MNERTKEGGRKAADGGQNYDNLNRLTQEILQLFLTRLGEETKRTGGAQNDPDVLRAVADRIARGEDPALKKVYERNWRPAARTRSPGGPFHAG